MKKSSDDEYVRKIIKAESTRKLSIIFLVSLALIMLIPVSYYSHKILNELQQISTGLKSNNKEIKNKALEKSAENTGYYIGLAVGAGLSAAFLSIATMLGNAIALYMAKRKDLLLIKYYKFKND